MADPTLYEYELLYGRHIIGEPRPVPHNDTLTFVCPPGTVGYMRNELSYRCTVGADGLGHFEALEPDVKPDCHDIRCPRNDTRTGSVLDITYPYYERRCAEDGDCKLGMITSLNCSHSESGFKPLSQCVVPENATTLATDANELELAVLSGIWYPPPACDRGCSPPVNVSGGMNCETGRRFARGEWNFLNEFVVTCACKPGYVRDDGSFPEATCNGPNNTWTPTKPCHVDCGPTPTLPHAIQEVTYYTDYALMSISCKEGYQLFPVRDGLSPPAISQCHHGNKHWLNMHLFECKAIDGCRATEITSKYTDIYLFPQKDMFNDLEVAVATCTRGYLESKTLYEVLSCKTVWEEVPNNKTWQPIATTLGEPEDLSAWPFFPNVTMKFVRFEWDLSFLKGNLTCITDDESFGTWEIID